MRKRVFLPLAIATLACTGFTKVEAISSKRPYSPKKPISTAPVKSQWRLFTAPDGSFSVLMPGKPKMLSQIQKTFMGEIDLKIFVGQPPAPQEVAYIVTYNEFPYSYAQLVNPQVILNNARDMALKTTQSHLLAQRPIRSSNGHPGKEIEYINTGGKITKNRMYVAEGRLYQVMVIITKKQRRTLSKTIDGYLNSFQVVLKR
jgi:hypothetical protein